MAINKFEETQLLYESLLNLIDEVAYVATPNRRRFLSMSNKISKWLPDGPSEFMSDPSRFMLYIHPHDKLIYESFLDDQSDEIAIKYRLVNGQHTYVVHDRSIRIRNAKGEAIIVHGTLHILSNPSISNKPASIIRLVKSSAPYIVDPITGIPERQSYFRHLQTLKDEAGAVLWIGISGLGKINEHFGLAGGDEVLAEAKIRLQTVLPPSSFLARVSATEFAALVDGFDAPHETMALCSTIQSILSCPLRMNDEEDARIKPAIGVAFVGNNSVFDASDWAHIAYREAKQSSREKIVFFDQSIEMRRQNRIHVEKQLRMALSRNRVVPFFQPKVSVDGVLCGFEALARVYDADGQVLMPSDFIPVAESTGLISNLGNWMLSEAPARLSLSSALKAIHLKLSLAINVSVKQLHDSELLTMLKLVIEANPKFTFELEITESVFIDWSPRIRDLFSEFRRAGAKIVLDDFGTGYSSLAYISRYPVDVIKLDRLFISDIDTDDSKKKLVDAIIKMAHSLGIRVVAEGIETENQRDIVVSLGVDEMQGFLFGLPMPPHDLVLPGIPPNPLAAT